MEIRWPGCRLTSTRCCARHVLSVRLHHHQSLLQWAAGQECRRLLPAAVHGWIPAQALALASCPCRSPSQPAHFTLAAPRTVSAEAASSLVGAAPLLCGLCDVQLRLLQPPQNPTTRMTLHTVMMMVVPTALTRTMMLTTAVLT